MTLHLALRTPPSRHELPGGGVLAHGGMSMGHMFVVTDGVTFDVPSTVPASSKSLTVTGECGGEEFSLDFETAVVSEGTEGDWADLPLRWGLFGEGPGKWTVHLIEHEPVVTSRFISVDAGIAPLVEHLWSQGVETRFSCEEWDEGVAQVVFNRLDDADRFTAHLDALGLEPFRRDVAALYRPNEHVRLSLSVHFPVDFIHSSELWPSVSTSHERAARMGS